MGESKTMTPYDAAMAWRKRAGIDSPPVEVDREDGAETVTVEGQHTPVALRTRLQFEGQGVFIRAGGSKPVWLFRTELAALLPAFVSAVAYGTLADPSAYQPGEYPEVPASEPASTALRAVQFDAMCGEVVS